MSARALWLGGAATLLISGATVAAEPDVAGDAYPTLKGGADLRVRQEYYDNIPRVTGPSVENNYLRVRTRGWGEIDFAPNVLVLGRLTNEFRYYWEPNEDAVTDIWPFAGEAAVDALYLDWKGLLDNTLDVRLGRQDMMYGNGRVLMDGTPKDGSRTFYRDGFKLSYRGLADNTVDFLGIYDSPENQLAINSQNYDLTGLFGPVTVDNDMTEKGGGLYWKSKTYQSLPFEAYWLFKEETEWSQPAAGRPPPQATREGNQYVNPELNLNTFGVRLIPKFGPELDANLEMAYQVGERGSADQTGYMVDALLNWRPPVVASLKPVLGAGWYLLSGDDPSTPDKNEGWDPLWARWPQYSELYVYAWQQVGYWTNLSLPHVDLELAPTSWYKTNVLLGYMYAMEDDGPGTGKDRGLLFTWWNHFTMGEKLLMKGDKLTGHLLLEIVDPGDYYSDDSTSVFARWNLQYTF